MAAIQDHTLLITSPRPEAVELPEERSDRPTPEAGELFSMAKDVHAPLGLFGRTGADVAEEIAFRTLFIVAAAITTYGVACAV